MALVDLTQLTTRFEEFVSKRMAAEGIPGVSVAITDAEGMVYQKVFGLSDLSARTPVTSDTLFQIGSISKSFTVLALMGLADKGSVGLRDPVTDYLPWLKVRSQHRPVTLHDLMTHTAGLPIGTDSTLAPESEVWALRDMDALAPPGELFHYSNTGYKILGLVLEHVTGRSYADVISEAVLGPLGMTRTYPVITNEIRRGSATGYTWLWDDVPNGRRAPLCPAAWFEGNTGDGAISSVAEDMATYARMLINGGMGDRARILSEEGFAAMSARHVRADPEKDEFYGYGLDTIERSGRTYLGHTGGMVGYTSSMLIDVEARLGVTVLTNSLNEPEHMSWFLMELVRALLEGRPLPEATVPKDRYVPEDPAVYAGVFNGSDGSLVVVSKEGGLCATVDGEEFQLEGMKEDSFLLDHPRFRRFLVRFVRDGGKVVGLVNGPRSYSLSGERGPSETPMLPAAWEAFIGHYRAYNPWLTNFRVVARDGMLYFIDPSGAEEPMTHLHDSIFRIGRDRRSPETVGFDMVIEGKTYRANLAGGPYSRTFTP